jgi:hypothetical protein
MMGWIRSEGSEIRLFLGYVLVVFTPGGRVPSHPQPPLQTGAMIGWSDVEHRFLIDEARREIDRQQTEKRDARARAQIVFATTLVLGAAIAANWHSRAPAGWLLDALSVLAFALDALAGLAAAGLITGRSDIGGPDLVVLPNLDPAHVVEETAGMYAKGLFTGAATVSVMVTVLRDSVLVLLLSFAAFAVAFVAAL